jgi:hypothetical protein
MDAGGMAQRHPESPLLRHHPERIDIKAYFTLAGALL